MNQKKIYFFVFIFSFALFSLSGQIKLDLSRYHTPSELNSILKNWAESNPGITKLHRIAKSPGGNTLYLLEVGPEVNIKKKTLPAVLVAANMEGTVPISSEAAVYLIQLLLKKGELRKEKTWYILPVGNPDAAVRFFKKPLTRDSRNNHAHNDDMDDRVDEDGVEDLDGNKIITMMRVKDPEGQWLPVPGEPRLLKKADWSKGERGIYKLYTEGVDNDRDGKYNEDGTGGVNVGINFPHLFKFFTKTGGDWAGSETESFNLIKFINVRREIAITFVFGDTNFCLIPPRGGRKGSADFAKIKIPERIGKIMNVDTSRTYTMKEIMEMVKRFVPEGFEVTESMVASFFGLGAVVNPLPEDLKFYNKLSEKFKDFLKKNKLDDKRLDPLKAKDGSFELWSYYHLGLPSFSLDFWTLPQVKEKKKEGSEITPEKLEKMSKEDFLALGKEKITAFLKASGAPANIKAEMVMKGVESGMMTTKRMAEMLRKMPKKKSAEGGKPEEKALLAFSDKQLKGKGFVDWKPFQHPELGAVEIGGSVPFTDNTPPPAMIEKLLKGNVPWVFTVVEKIAKVRINKTAVKPLGKGLYSVKAWAENKGFIPYPTAMGIRNVRISPVVLSLGPGNYRIIEGKKRALIKSLKGNSVKMVKWIVYSKKPLKLQIKLTTQNAGHDSRQVILGGKK